MLRLFVAFCLFCFVLFYRESYNNTGWPLYKGESDKERTAEPEDYSERLSSQGAAAI